MTTEPRPIDQQASLLKTGIEDHDDLEDMRVADLPSHSGTQTPKEPVGIIDIPVPEVSEPTTRPTAYITEVPGISIGEPSAEVQAPVEHAGYDLAAEDMIQQAPHFNETQNFYMAQAFLDSLIASVGRGEVTARGEVIDIDDFKYRLFAMLDELKLPTEERKYKNPLMLLPSSGGMRDAFARLLSDEAKPTRFQEVLKDMKFSDEAPELAGKPPKILAPSEAVSVPESEHEDVAVVDEDVSELRTPLKFPANAPLPLSAFPNYQPPVVRSVDDMPPLPPDTVDSGRRKITVIHAQPTDPPKKKWYQ